MSVEFGEGEGEEEYGDIYLFLCIAVQRKFKMEREGEEEYRDLYLFLCITIHRDFKKVGNRFEWPI